MNQRHLIKNYSIEQLTPVSKSPTSKKDVKAPNILPTKIVSPLQKEHSTKATSFRKELAKIIVGQKENRDLSPKVIHTDRLVSTGERISHTNCIPTTRARPNISSFQLHVQDVQIETRRGYNHHNNTTVQYERATKHSINQSKALEDHSDEFLSRTEEVSIPGDHSKQSAVISSSAIENLIQEMSILKQTIGNLKNQITFLVSERENDQKAMEDMRVELNVLRGMVADGMIERKKQQIKNSGANNLFEKICNQQPPKEKTSDGHFTFANQSPESDVGKRRSIGLLNQSPLQSDEFFYPVNPSRKLAMNMN